MKKELTEFGLDQSVKKTGELMFLTTSCFAWYSCTDCEACSQGDYCAGLHPCYGTPGHLVLAKG